MAEDDLIERLWAERKEEPKMSREEIENVLRLRVGRSTHVLRIYVWIYLTVLMAILVLQGMNLGGYRTNATMLAVQSVVTAFALGFAGFGVYLMGEVGRLERLDENLSDAIKRRLAFFRGKYEAWLWSCAASCLLLIWAVNTLVDNAEGTYRINKPFFFAGVNAAILFGMYALSKAAHVPFVHELRATLEDLEAQVMDRTAAVEALKVRWRRWAYLLVALLIILALLGLWRALTG
jgi:hypothetical protein